MNVLDSKGHCKKCKKDAQNEYMECWMCQNQYHVIECDDENPMVQPSFLKNQWPTILRKWTCITFTCPNCREDAKTKQEHIMSQRMRLVEERTIKTDKKLDDITELLLQKKSQENEVQTAKTFASVVRQDSPSLIIIDKPEKEMSKDEKKVKMDQLDKVARESKVSVKKTFTNKAGKTVLVMHNEKSKNVILPHVKELFNERKINTPKPRLPTISIPFIQGNYEKDELLTALKNQNEDNGLVFDRDNAEIIFIAPMKNKDGDLYQAVLRVTDDLRGKIDSNNNRVFIGSTSCPVYDRFYVKRCNKCQGFHHYVKDCKRNEICGKCSEHHETKNCNNDFFKCINCAISGYGEIEHCAYSIECPTYLAEQEKLRKSINYYSKN